MKGLLRLHGAFRRHLRHQKKKVAALQMLGRLEEYLTKEFASVILLESGNSVLPLTNLGRRKEHRIDISLIEGDLASGQFSDRSFRERAAIRALVEVKYLRNMSRIGPSLKGDEISETLKDLKRQLQYSCKNKHAGYHVNLRNSQNDIYGLLIVSYVREVSQADSSASFIKTIKDRASKMGFRYEDLPTPQIRQVYRNIRVPILKREYRASLYSGLWRLNS